MFQKGLIFIQIGKKFARMHVVVTAKSSQTPHPPPCVPSAVILPHSDAGCHTLNPSSPLRPPSFTSLTVDLASAPPRPTATVTNITPPSVLSSPLRFLTRTLGLAFSPPRATEDRLNGKRNSLTSADRDSGNGDSLDVAASQPCNLSYGTRFFTLNGGGTVIGIPTHQSIERTAVMEKCGTLYGGLTAVASGITSQAEGIPENSIQLNDAYALPRSQKMVCNLVSSEPGDQYVALELRSTPQSHTEATSIASTHCGPGSPCTLRYLETHSNERADTVINSPPQQQQQQQQQQRQNQRIDLRESFSLEKLTTTFV
ncbi:unnamed protein product [Schistocephalus solidus]|uniref:Uncharacterized protein n=1 Tax=Schistocephalus solidus TaxID=70667 RepID=A0A183S8C5_SCHSO|nr:unnamed protein product [Schistocephalus solidus]